MMNHFNSEGFDAMLNDMGQEVFWRRAYACPCINPKSGQAKMGCPFCAAKGRIWQDPVACKTGVAGRSAQKQWLQFGIADIGDVLISIPSDSDLYGIGPFDRVFFANRTEPFSQNVVKGVNEQIRFFVVSVEKVLYIDSSNNLIEADLPAVRSDGTLDWDSVPLPDGVTFSITGRRKAEYFCYPETPFDRPHHSGATLPRRVVLRRFDLYGNS